MKIIDEHRTRVKLKKGKFKIEKNKRASKMKANTHEAAAACVVFVKNKNFAACASGRGALASSYVGHDAICASLHRI